MSAAPRRVGMYGGAFDPPHRAHVAVAEAALRQLQLDRLHVFPTGDAWHKQRILTPGAHRLEMARLSFAHLPQVQVDDAELRRSGPTYSVDTLRALQAQHPAAQLYLLMGEDQAAGFTGWHAWQEIARLAVLAVAQRGEAGGVESLRALPGVRMVALQMPRMPVSATEIRARLTAGQDIAQLVVPAVASYIARNDLYRPT